MLLHGGQALGWVSTAPAFALTIGLGPTVVFLVLLIWILSHPTPQSPTAVNRAVGAVFGAVGLANLVLIVIIAKLMLR